MIVAIRAKTARRLAATLAVLSIPLAGAGCTSGDKDASHASPPAPAGESLQEPAAQPPAAGSGISPAGVTTSVNAAPSSLEEEYYQACRAAADWMVGKPDPRERLVEGYLQSVQTSETGGAGTFHQLWHELAAERQAAVIVAANAAAQQQC